MSRGSLPPLEDDFSRALLGSAEADAPSSAAYAKAAAALGIGVGLGVGASLPAPAALAAGAAGAAGVARWSSSLLGVKLWALGVAGVLLVGAGALLVGKARPTKSQDQSALARAAQGPAARAASALPRSERNPSGLPLASRLSPSVLSPVSPAVSPPISAQSTGLARAIPAERAAASAAAVPLAAPLAARRIAHAAPASAARTAATRPSTGSSLAEQVQSLDRARVALGSGDTSSALREIAHYRAAWPDGVFLTEASVLEIEALAARGERSLARVRAADFVEAHPDSPQADRLRALIPAKKH